MTKELNLAPIKARLEKATEGPWSYEETVLGLPNSTVMAEGQQVGYMGIGHFRGPNAHFVAHSRTDVPALIAEVERLRIYKSEMVEKLAESSIFTAKRIGWSVEYITEAMVNTGVQGVFAENAKLRAQIERVREALTAYEVIIRGSIMPGGRAIGRYATMTGAELYNQVREALGGDGE